MRVFVVTDGAELVFAYDTTKGEKVAQLPPTLDTQPVVDALKEALAFLEPAQPKGDGGRA